MDFRKRWYDNRILVLILVLFIFPVGFYGLFKSERFSKLEEWAVVLLFFFGPCAVVVATNPPDKPTPSNNIIAKPNPSQASTNLQVNKSKSLPGTPPKQIPSKWYENGSLHKTTVSQWKKATPQNKLATAADITIGGSKKIKAKVMSSSNMDILKPYASGLVNCIDEAVAEHNNADHQSVAEISAMCMILMGWN